MRRSRAFVRLMNNREGDVHEYNANLALFRPRPSRALGPLLKHCAARFQSSAADLSDMRRSISWEVVNFTAEREVKFYDCCPEGYHSITFTLTARRNEHRTAELAMPIVCEWPAPARLASVSGPRPPGWREPSCETVRQAGVLRCGSRSRSAMSYGASSAHPR